MKTVINKEKKIFRTLGTDVSEWADGTVELSMEEIEIIRKAQSICEKANELMCKLNNDPDNFNSFGEADHALSDILENFGSKEI